MPNLKGSKTHKNLKDAFAGESQANRRYLYFARQADIEGYPDVGGLFRDTAEAETGHAHGHLDYLKVAGDPATDKPIGRTDKNLAAAVAEADAEIRLARLGLQLLLGAHQQEQVGLLAGRHLGERGNGHGAGHSQRSEPRAGRFTAQCSGNDGS